MSQAGSLKDKDFDFLRNHSIYHSSELIAMVKELITAHDKALLNELKGQAVELYEHQAAEPYPTKQGVSNIHYRRVEAIKLSAVEQMIKGLGK